MQYNWFKEKNHLKYTHKTQNEKEQVSTTDKVIKKINFIPLTNSIHTIFLGRQANGNFC